MSLPPLRTQRSRSQAAEDREGAFRFALAFVGVAMGGFGALMLLTGVAPADLWPLVRWGVAGILVHDGLWAPVAVGVGLGVLPRAAAPRGRTPPSSTSTPRLPSAWPGPRSPLLFSPA